MGCPTALRRIPFSSATRRSLPGSTTKVSFSEPVSWARTGMLARPKAEQEIKIHTTLRFIVSLVSYQNSGAFPRSDRPAFEELRQSLLGTKKVCGEDMWTVCKELNGA